MVRERQYMSLPQNRYYLRSCDNQSSGESTPDQEQDHSGDTSLELSDIEAEVIFDPNISVDLAETETEMASFHITMPPFHGNTGENAKDWIGWFTNFADAHGFNADKRRQTMPFYLKDHALAWYNAQTPELKANQENLTAAMQLRFNGSDGLDADMALLSLTQLPSESCNNYFTRILKVTQNKEYPDSLVTGIALKGLSLPIRQIVMPQNHKTLEGLRLAAILAEKTVMLTTASAASVNVDDITKRVLDEVSNKLADVMAFGHNSHVENGHNRERPQSQPPQTWSRQRRQHPSYQDRQAAPTAATGQPCGRCGGKFLHSIRECSAIGMTCVYCGKPNHYTETCLKKKRDDAMKAQ